MRPSTSNQQSSVPPAVSHEHAWATRSAHRTSAGEVVYVRCVECGAHRVDLRVQSSLPPTAVSTAVGGK